MKLASLVPLRTLLKQVRPKDPASELLRYVEFAILSSGPPGFSAGPFGFAAASHTLRSGRSSAAAGRLLPGGASGRIVEGTAAPVRRISGSGGATGEPGAGLGRRLPARVYLDVSGAPFPGVGGAAGRTQPGTAVRLHGRRERGGDSGSGHSGVRHPSRLSALRAGSDRDQVRGATEDAGAAVRLLLDAPLVAEEYNRDHWFALVDGVLHQSGGEPHRSQAGAGASRR